MLSNQLLALTVLTPLIYLLYPILLDPKYQYQIVSTLIVSIVGYITTISLIPYVKEMTLKAGLSGKDLNKGEEGKKTEIPESLGIVPGVTFVVSVCLLQVFLYENVNLEYNAALFSICFMLFLGFADDVLDLRWRYKLILPAFATIPLLVAYSGKTLIVVPKPLRLALGMEFLELGIFYRVYMLMVAIFCSNAINIYAGINGLEAGQSLIIAISISIHNIIELSGPFAQYHLFSLVFMLPFIAITLGLLKFNWYPSQVFVGDSFAYFAGMTLAVVGILGHFSKTLMLFFIPQWLNFLFSLPQLLLPWWFPCPRHRLPQYSNGKLVNSGNYTMINFALYILGPTTEKALVIILLAFQILCCGLGFYIRYHLSKLYYDEK